MATSFEVDVLNVISASPDREVSHVELQEALLAKGHRQPMLGVRQMKLDGKLAVETRIIDGRGMNYYTVK